MDLRVKHCSELPTRVRHILAELFSIITTLIVLVWRDMQSNAVENFICKVS